MKKMLYNWPIEIALQAAVTQEGNFDHNELFIYLINKDMQP